MIAPAFQLGSMVEAILVCILHPKMEVHPKLPRQVLSLCRQLKQLTHAREIRLFSFSLG